MKIYIPSRGRWSDKFLSSAYHPMRWMPKDLYPRTVFVVRSDEVENYQRTLARFPGVKVLDIGSPANLSRKRVLIAEHAAENDEQTFLMSDDDVMLYIRKSDTEFNLRYPTEDEVQDLLVEKIPDLLTQYPMVGISAREGNNRAGVGPWPLIQECTRSMRFYAFRTWDYLSVDTGRLSEMADFDTTLQLLRSGRKNAVIWFWAQGQPTSQLAGGCSIYRTSETHDAICRKLAEYHPDFVRLRQKENKGHQSGFGTRTEVTISWQKAFRSSQV